MGEVDLTVVERLTREAEHLREPKKIVDGLLHYRDSDGDLQTLHVEQFDDAPFDIAGTIHISRLASFITYLAEFERDDSPTPVYVDPGDGECVAVFNDSDGEGPGWGDHRAHFMPETTREWDAWIDASGKLMDQTDFAEFIEDHLHVFPDGAGVSSADMLEIAQSLQVTAGVDFKSSSRLTSGAIGLKFEETHSAVAGGIDGQIEVPQRFTVNLQPFKAITAGDEGKPVVYELNVRFRYRATAAGLKLGIVLDRPERVFDLAVGDIVQLINDSASVRVIYGSPLTHRRAR